MQFNPDPSKQAKEVTFSRKSDSANVFHPPIKLNNNSIPKCPSQKHLGIVLDSKLDFSSHVDDKIKKCNKLIGLIRRLSVNLPRKALLTIYKSIIRPYLDYCDILYDKPNNVNFQDKIEKVQYRACLAITGPIQGTSKEKIYDDLGLHSLTKRQWRSKLIFFYKIVNGLLPDYLYSYLHCSSEEIYPLRSAGSSKLRPFSSRTISFKNTFFPYCVNKWNNLKADIRNAKSLNIFKKLIISEKRKILYFQFTIHSV